ncbi:collagen, type I, alpha 1a-like [Plodia interpunctella]|uniref:collagen, type I, alpha 1a-like n=1 Tax=Plodia interpunctella TaxID=58824 RepID=UPI0023686D9B|nr:spidroin-2-like [Plodia interpunctella]
MKLFIVLSVLACGYAAKLDRTYLPPASAATAGGSPGSLTTPFGSPTGPGSNQMPGQAPSFGSSSSGQFPPNAPSPGSGQPTFGSSASGRFPQAFSGTARPSSQGQSYPQSSQSGLNGPSSLGQSFGQGNQPAGPSNQYGSAASGRDSNPGFGPSGFGSNQGGAQTQPERPQAAADRNAEILRYENENDGNTFAYSFETSNGISAEESGVATNGVQAQGGFSYTGDDGEVYKVTYTADENGYQPSGDHLPTSPPIPDEILRSIEENARAAAAGTQEGAYNPDEDDSGSPQQYSGSSPSFNQGQGPSSSYNQPQGSAHSSNQPQGPAQSYNQPQGSSPSYNQLQGSSPSYNQPQGSSPSYNQPQAPAQGPSQQYGAPNSVAGSGPFNKAQSGPRNQFSGASSFNQSPSGPQGNSQFGAPTASGQGLQQFGSQPNAAATGSSRPFSAPSQSSQGNNNGYEYNRPQGSSGSFTASRQDQSSAQSRPSQQYGAPSPSATGSSQRPSQQYGAPTNGGSNQVSPQYGAPIASGRGSSQAPQGSPYNAPSTSNAGRGSSQGPSQQYGAPSTSSRGPVQTAQQYNPPSPSQQYGTPNTPSAPTQQYGAPNGGRGSQGPQFGSPNAATPSGNTGFPGSFPRQDQSSAQSRPQGNFGQAQNENGYQYGRPQGAPFGQGPSGNRPQSGQQLPASQYNQPAQSGFPRPGSSASQTPAGSNFGTGPTTGPAAALVSQSLVPGSRVVGTTPAGGRIQGSFGSAPGQSSAGQPAMTDATQYNQSGTPSHPGSQTSQSSFRPAAPTFGGPRQPPSFSPETGYVY